ncbi:hypothetical protein P3S67_008494 [Capsicum chacoense]
MRSWMAEGFLKLKNDLEGEAESMQKMQLFKRVTGDEFDFCPYGIYRDLLTPVHHQLRDYDDNDLLKQTRSIFSFHLEYSFSVLKSELIHFKLLIVLELEHRDRYFPSTDSKPHLVEIMVVEGDDQSFVTCPVQIWGLMQLRHLKLPTFYLPDCPSGSADKGRHLDFSNLQTISYLSPRCCTNEVILGIQNVKKLGIKKYVTDYGCYRDGRPVNNLVHLHQLETLSFTYCGLLPESARAFPASAKAFPATLKKLKLVRTKLCWSNLNIIAELPNLEVPKLMDDACLGKKWYPNVRGFNRLKLLLIEDNDVEY